MTPAITINANLICKLTLNEEDVQNEMETEGKTREEAIYSLAFHALPIDLEIKDAEFTELTSSPIL